LAYAEELRFDDLSSFLRTTKDHRIPHKTLAPEQESTLTNGIGGIAGHLQQLSLLDSGRNFSNCSYIEPNRGVSP
jgi:hypothetical protein